MTSLTFSKISAANFSDFRSLLCSGRTSGQCFCLSHRVEPQDLEIEDMAAQKMKNLVERRRVNGLLAYDKDIAVGWIGVEPVATLVGHDVYDLLLKAYGPEGMADTTWGIHCIYLHPDVRGRGLAAVLIAEAEYYARDRGAEKIWAFPSSPLVEAELPLSQKFAGPYHAYLNLGFHQVQNLTDSYLLVEKVLSSGPRRRFAVVDGL